MFKKIWLKVCQSLDLLQQAPKNETRTHAQSPSRFPTFLWTTGGNQKIKMNHSRYPSRTVHPVCPKPATPLPQQDAPSTPHCHRSRGHSIHDDPKDSGNTPTASLRRVRLTKKRTIIIIWPSSRCPMRSLKLQMNDC